MRNQLASLKTAVMPLVFVNIIFFILQILFKEQFTSSLVLISTDIFTRPWILLTHMFLHGGGEHIFFNMFGLVMFGPILEEKIGAARFLMVYIGSGIIAAIIYSLFHLAIGARVSALGASGAIMGMLGTLIILLPQLRLLLFFAIPMPLWFAGILWAAIDIWGVFFPSGTGNLAHLVGLCCGLLFGLYLKNKQKKFHKKFKKKQHISEDDFKEYMKTGRI